MATIKQHFFNGVERNWRIKGIYCLTLEVNLFCSHFIGQNKIRALSNSRGPGNIGEELNVWQTSQFLPQSCHTELKSTSLKRPHRSPCFASLNNILSPYSLFYKREKYFYLIPFTVSAMRILPTYLSKCLSPEYSIICQLPFLKCPMESQFSVGYMRPSPHI